MHSTWRESEFDDDSASSAWQEGGSGKERGLGGEQKRIQKIWRTSREDLIGNYARNTFVVEDELQHQPSTRRRRRRRRSPVFCASTRTRIIGGF